MSREADRLADQLQADPIIAEDLAVPGFSRGDVSKGDEMGDVFVSRVYRGPDQPLQTVLEDRVQAAGWSAIGIRCRNDGRGFTLTAKRRLDERVAGVEIQADDDGDGRKLGIEVSARVEGGTDWGVAPKPIEQCE